MFYYQLSTQFSDWSYFHPHPERTTPNAMIDLPIIAELVMPGITDKDLKIVDVPQLGYPVAFPNKNIIFLTTAGVDYYAQNVFQIGHELCHFYINSALYRAEPTPQFWFEEVLCEMSSHYYLRTFSNLWRSFPNPEKQKYSSNFLDYSDNRFKNDIDPFDVSQLLDNSSPLTRSFQEDPEQRPKNTYIASLLLPIFEKNPKLFAELPKLGPLYSFPNFQQLLETWKQQVTGENRNSILEIIALFHG